jgi:CRP-like cAMP-binding protein
MRSVNAAIDELMSFEIFEGYTQDKILKLCENGHIEFTSHREYLFHAGVHADFFGVVLSGAYKLSKPSFEGNDTIVHFSMPGDTIAAFIMAQKDPFFPLSAISMGASRFLKLPRENYLHVWKNETDLIFKVQNLLSSRMGQIQDQKTLQRAPLSQRVATLLLTLIEKNSSSVEGLAIAIPLTRKDIADSLGSAVESIIRLMSEWSKLGIIRTNDHQIHILRIDKVIAFSKFEKI